MTSTEAAATTASSTAESTEDATEGGASEVGAESSGSTSDQVTGPMPSNQSTATSNGPDQATASATTVQSSANGEDAGGPVQQDGALQAQQGNIASIQTALLVLVCLALAICIFFLVAFLVSLYRKRRSKRPSVLSETGEETTSSSRSSDSMYRYYPPVEPGASASASEQMTEVADQVSTIPRKFTFTQSSLDRIVQDARSGDEVARSELARRFRLCSDRLSRDDRILALLSTGE
ncbi:MAG: hypothetical protein SGCHY_003729 [Lobulomycetales sp.]